MVRANKRHAAHPVRLITHGQDEIKTTFENCGSDVSTLRKSWHTGLIMEELALAGERLKDRPKTPGPEAATGSALADFAVLEPRAPPAMRAAGAPGVVAVVVVSRAALAASRCRRIGSLSNAQITPRPPMIAARCVVLLPGAAQQSTTCSPATDSHAQHRRQTVT
jgi:hypothetical protein